MKRIWSARPLGVTTVLCMLFSAALAAPQAHAATDKYYAAFAYAIVERVAVVDSGTDPDSAAAAAEAACHQQGGGTDCQAVGWWTNGYASFALGPDLQWAWGTSPTSIEAADKFAMDRCGSGCQLTMRNGIGGSGYNWSDMVPLHDGNYSVGGYTEGVPDHTGRDFWAVDFYSDQRAVYPTRAGTVAYSDYNCEIAPGNTSGKCYGNTVAIDHGDGYYSIYTHLLNNDYVQLGQQVTISTQIGVMDESGCSGCGVHLHYAMHRGTAGLSGRMVLWDASLEAVRTPWHA